MADTKISACPAVTALTSSDIFPVVQSGVNKRATLDQMLASVQPSGGQGIAPNGVVSGLGVFYSGTGLTFTMSAGTFNINGVLTTAIQQDVTLAAADGSNPRIDVIYVDDTGTIGKVTGTAAASPSQPTVDPTSQLMLTFVQVPTSAATITGITNENVYLEDTEWTTTVIGSGVTKASTNNPYAGTKDVEFTSTPAASGIQFVRSSAISFDGEGNLTFRIRSKATWNTKRWLTFQWMLAGVAKGAPVILKSGTYGFDSSVTASYQLAVINKLQFAIPAGTNVDTLMVLDVGGAIGLYLDNIILQSNGSSTGGTGVQGITQAQADARYLPLVPRVQTVSSSPATVTPTSLNDAVVITAQGQALTIANPTGTWASEQGLCISIKDNGTARALTFGNKYRIVGTTLPATTVLSKLTRLGFVYNAADDKFDCVAVAQEA